MASAAAASPRSLVFNQQTADPESLLQCSRSTRDGKTLADAIKLIERADASTTGGATNWPHLAQLFYEHKTGSGQISERTWKRNYRLRIDRAVEILTGSPALTGGKGLLERIVPHTSPRAGIGHHRPPPVDPIRLQVS